MLFRSYDIANIEPRILEERIDLSYGDQNSENMIIHGDNLLALKALLPEFEGKVKCIYIDPPYNTGSAFEHYDDSVEHSTWLSLMKPRLELLKILLHENGSIWVSIDDNEAGYLRVLLDEVFGRNEFVTTIIWEKRTTRENRRAFSFKHDYLIVFAKNKKMFESSMNGLPLSKEVIERYKNPDNDPRGKWQSVSLNAQSGHATKSQFYTIKTPSGRELEPPQGRCWSVTKERMDELIADNRVWFGIDGTNAPRLKRFLNENLDDTLTPETIWYADDVGTNDSAKKFLNQLFKSENSFDTPKPEQLIQRILQIASNPQDWILDSFIGSGTTAAVAHKMSRKYIAIEMGDHAYSLVQKRMQKVVDGGDSSEVSETLKWKGGGGFKFYELAPSFIVIDEFGNPVIDSFYNDMKLIRAMCKLTNYTFAPSQTEYWKHGKGQGSNSIYVTTQMLSVAMVQQIVSHLGQNETLLICPKKYEPGCKEVDNRIMIKKIPQSVLKACQFGKKEYLLPIKENAMEEVDEEDSPETQA